MARWSLQGRARARAAALYRAMLLMRTTFVVVTGSCGKTTAKELIATVLASRFRGYRSPAHCNSAWHVVRNVLQTRPWHRFSVSELPGAGSALFPLDDLLPILRPTISVVTSIGQDHHTVFRTLDAAARHKGKVVDWLPPGGVAVLNADDARVAAMRTRCAGRVVTCGTSLEADIRATDVSSAWPERLSFVATSGSTSIRVQTQLCGTHWVPHVLAALAVGEVMGIPLAMGAEAIAAMPAFPGRLSPVTTADGITFVRDDDKAPLWTVDAALNFMKAARASRRIVVFGTISDFPGTDRPKVVAAGRRALECADALVGVGAQAPYHLRAGRELQRPASAHANAEQARRFLRGFLRPGDLVLLKGSSKADDLEHIVRNWNGSVETLLPGEVADGRATHGGRPVRIIVGLGNPDPVYAQTPHNVGYRTLDIVAARLGTSWERQAGATVASAVVDGADVRLVKLAVAMNETGESLRRLADRLGASAIDCVIVHDDLDLPPGTIRWRSAGSAGGHRGLASIQVAFQSDAVRRVKVGLGRPVAGTASEFVLTHLDPKRHAIVEASLERAADLTLEALVAPADAKGRTLEVAVSSGRVTTQAASSTLALAGGSR
jgi:UDP-N-acetylmuramoyl-tripeptide--D-alanyl-D-alanine ligase